MKEISFVYNGRQHSGHIISSTNIEPHYHWVYFQDGEMSAMINDDCIGFIKTASGLLPTKIYGKYSDLVQKVQDLVERNIP